MSRFDTARRSRILVWTGAALTWATALTIAVLEPESAQANVQSPTPQQPALAVVPTSQVAALPTPPSEGLLILRYQPSKASTPEVRTVYVQQKTPRPAPAPSPVLAPAPKSSGS